jgi:hypothetical protein
MQEQLAEEIVNYSWRLRRVPRAERLLFDKYHRAYDPEPRMDPQLEDELLEMEEAEGPRPEEDILGFDDVVTDQTPSGLMCQMLEKRDRRRNEPDSPVWRLDRYADRLERARASVLRLLLALQRRKPHEAEDEDAFEEEEDEEVIDGTSPAAPLEGAPAVADASAGPPLAVSQTEARADAAHRSAKPQAAVEESSASPTGAGQIIGSTSISQNKPNATPAGGNTEVTVSNEYTINEPFTFAPGVPGSKANPKPFPDMTMSVEPSPSIGESPSPTT